MTLSLNHPEDLTLTRALTADALASAGAQKALTTRNVLFGASALIGATGLAVALVIMAINYKADTLALKNAIAAMPPIKIAVELPKDGIDIAPDAKVRLDVPADAKVKLDVPEQQTQIEKLVTAEPGGKPGDKAITREVTVFSNVEDGVNSVVTGWTYANGKAEVPVSQYCYVSMPQKKADGTVERLDIGSNGKLTLPGHAREFAKCVWFDGGRVDIVNPLDLPNGY